MRLFGGLDGNSPTPPLPYPRDYSFKDSHNCIHHAPPSSPVFVYMSRVDGNTWTPLLIFCIDTHSKKTTKKTLFFSLYFILTCFCFVDDACSDPLSLSQVDRGRARRGVHTPSTRSGNWRGSSSSAFTSTRRSVCSCHGCWTWQTARWRSGSRTGGWRRRNWTETVYSTTPQTHCYKTWAQTGTAWPLNHVSRPGVHRPQKPGQEGDFLFV